MSESYACNVAGAVFNWIRSNNHGRGKFICRYFKISRSTLYRKVISFRHTLCTKPGHPPKDETQTSIRQLERKCSLLKSENEELMRTLKKERKRYEQNIKKLTFMLIAIGLSGRVIAWILRWAFKMPANHTDILKKAQGYAEKATAIMQAHFHQHGVVTAIDEVFIEGLPVFILYAVKNDVLSIN